jgi:hypothetical protein
VSKRAAWEPIDNEGRTHLPSALFFLCRDVVVLDVVLVSFGGETERALVLSKVVRRQYSSRR